jgi:RNA polymerase sigma-70 factor (ECF subfamily)
MTKEEQKQHFDKLHARYRPMVLQLCTGFVRGDTAQAADLCQEVFINAWRALAGFKGTSSHKTWLYRIAVNTCLQYLRKMKRRQEVPLQGLENQITESSGGRQEESRLLYRAIGQLDEVERLMIMMVLEQFTYEEIADILGLTQGNLRVKIHRTKNQLKKLIEHERQD